MIRNIVFDMGEVLIHFHPEEYVRRLGAAPEEERLLLNRVFRSVEWVQMDRGVKDEAAAIESICKRLPQRFHDAVRQLVLEWDQPVCPVEGMYELVQELKTAGYGIYLLSNASVRHSVYWPRVPVSRFFDGILVSSEVGAMKPQQEIYRLLCGRWGLRPEECFFIDDMPANVEAAVFCGMSGAVFHDGDVKELREELLRAGVVLPRGRGE